MKTINELNVGDIVIINGDLVARVVECVHGNPYYAFCGIMDDPDLYRYNDLSIKQVDEAVKVSDGGVVSLPCCG